ncbi:hypothetical protein BGZ96_007538 [Linnemannia gamsii]|uniref:START domain-containing protein n=1 Tax=Linnemannia gamsii TaxID=64522 RepID=A0ABQ7K1M9_9FUNG|nr:hypothetical protein BGZ96_007538 [Linnemannia gamsii]
MKGPSRSELAIADDNLEWIEQHHRATSRKAPATQKSQQQTLGQNLSQNQLNGNHDFVHSGDESDYAEKNRQSVFYAPDPHKRTKEYHIEQAIGAIKLLKAASKPEGWKKVFRHKSDCIVSQSTGNGDKHPAFKGEHVIRGFRAQDVFSIVGVRKLWDDWYDQLNCVESYDEATNLMYMVMKGNMSSKTRDISMVERIEVERDGTIYFASCSVESSKIPLMSGKVRADIFVAGWIIQPLPSNPPITKVTYVIQTDLLSRLPKFIARRALAKRPLVIATIETHLKKNGVPMVMSNLVSQTTNRHRSLSEPLKPEKFLFAERDSEENVQSGSSFLSPIEPLRPDNHVEELNTKDDTDDEDLQLAMASVSESSTARNSLAPSLLSTRSLAPSIFSPEFLENNAHLGDTAMFGDSVLFGKGGIYENTMRQQDDTSRASNDTNRTQSPQLTQTLAHIPERTRRAPPQAARTLPPETDFRDRHQLASQASMKRIDTPRSNPPPRNAQPSTPEQPVTPTVTLATPPLTPTTSVDGKDATSDSDASLTPKVRIVPRVPKSHTSVDTSLPQRPSSMAFAAYGMRSPSAIMEARRHSTLISRSSSFAPRHSHAVPIRGSPNITLQGMNRSSMIFNSTPNAMKRHSTAPSLDSNRSSIQLTPVIVLPHRHSETARKALAMFKVLASSPEDRWKAVSSDGTFKSYSRVISGAGLPMLRAEGVISGGWTVEQINAVIESSGCRQIWDERFDNLSIAETFNSNEYLFHVALRGIGSLTGRDLAGVTIVDRDPQTAALCNVSTSVLDSTIPEDPGRIRALLELSGWSLRPTFDGQGNTVSVNVTFVIQIDIRGTLPTSVVKSLTASMMTAVSRLNQFMNKSGYPPYASHISGTRLLDTFEPKTGFYELCYKAAPGWTEVRVGRKVYKDGYDFFIKPDDPTVRVELAPDFGGVRIWTTLDHEGQSIIAQVTRKGQNPAGNPAQEPSQPSQPDDEEKGSESDEPSRRKRESYVPRRPRDSRVFESSSPTFGGPSPRKSSSHLKSNDDDDVVELESLEQVDVCSSGDVGGGSELRPHEAAVSSIGRKRRSASFTTLSAFDPNLVVASSSYRPAELPQASMAPKASQESERTGRSRSRSRTPRSLINVPDGTPPPILPRRSSSLSRYSVPLSPPFLSPIDAPPMPIISTFTATSLTQGASLEPISATLADSPTTSITTSSGTTFITSPFSSPTLGPFHIPHYRPVESPMPGCDIFRATEEPQVLELTASANTIESGKKDTKESEPEQVSTITLPSALKKSILQPPAEIHTGSRVADSDIDASTLIARGVIPSISEVLAESSSVDSKSADIKVSLATMSSPLTSPIPAPRTSSLNHRSSNTSISSITRRVTFSPDVIDNSETRTTPLRPRRLSKKKSIPLKASPLAELQNLGTSEAVATSVTEAVKAATIVDVVSSPAVVEVATVAAMRVEVQDDTGYESDEAEFVEAQSELFDDTPDERAAAVAIVVKEDVVDVEAIGRREAEKEQMLVDMKGCYVGHEEVWRTATDSFVSELSMTQVKAVLMLVLVAVYASGLLAM